MPARRLKCVATRPGTTFGTNIARSHSVSHPRSRSMMMWMFDQFLVALDPRAGLLLASFSLASLAVAVAAQAAHASQRVIEFKLKNGLQVLVIPDHRAPVVTQMVWYLSLIHISEPTRRTPISYAVF